MKTLITISLLTFTLLAQERVLLRIGQDGQQEAIPLRPGERTQDAIERMEARRAQNISTSAYLVDTLRYFTTESDLTTNFGFTHQDVAMQWYRAEVEGVVKEFWWRNYVLRGVTNKGTIRSWFIDARVAALPSSPNTKWLGFYKDMVDGDGGVQPFKPDTGNQWYYSNGAADSVIYSFDMFTKETAWRKGGLQVSLDSNQWQGIVLNDHGESIIVKQGELFGFTLSNDSKKSDFGSGVDERMEILSFYKNAGAPYHSFKFYEHSRGLTNGWHMRGDYDWGMYALVEYTADRPPKISAKYIFSIALVPTKKFLFNITDDNPIGGPEGVKEAYFHFKKGVSTVSYDSIPLTKENTYYSVMHPSLALLDTIFWYVTASDVNGNRSTTPVRKLYRYGPKRSTLYVNNQQYEYHPSILPQPQLPYDVWSTRTDSTNELPTLFAMYKNIMLIDGEQPARNVYPAVSQWLSSGTPENKRNLFFTSQNYGCFITPNCGDTLFSTDAWEYQYLGIEKLGPQDIPPTSRPMRMIPQTDTITNYLLRFEKDSAVTLWCQPVSELGFAGYPDAMVPRSTASSLFKEGSGLLTLGIIHRGTTFNSLFLAFDDRALQFRSDTSLSFSADPKYHWIGEVKMLSAAFFESLITEVKIWNGEIPLQYSLSQNFPNPFNPSTTIEYSIPTRSDVTLSIFNILGQKVAELVNETKGPGSYWAEWNASRMASGMYFYELKANNYTSVKKMILLK